MAMNSTQLATFRAALLAETDPTLVALRQGGETGQIAAWYNVPTTFVVWRGTTPADDIADGIAWANLTPVDTPDASVTYTNRALVCQAKQINLQILLQGRNTIPTGKLNVRQGLQDALLNVPAGTAGALLDAGWAGAGRVKAVISRFATRAERIFATGTGTAAVPGFLGGFDGAVSNEDAVAALAG